MAVVLVGGEGTRLRPLTYTTPKPLLPICNRPFLERQLLWLASSGVDEVVLSMGYLPDAFKQRFPDDRFGEIQIRYAVEDEPLGTGGAIRFAAEGATGTFLVCNGDVLTDLDIRELLKVHEAAAAEATIALTQVEDPSAFGVVPTAEDGRVLAFVEKPPPGLAPTDWINAGTYVLEPSMLERIPTGVTASVERETFPRTLESGGALYAVQSDAFWLDIGVPRQFLDAQEFVLDGVLGFPPAPGAREQGEGIWVQGDVDVDPTARLAPPVLLGDGSVIGADVAVKRSVLGPGCRVREAASVVGSVLLDGAQVGARSAITDSIVGSGAEVQAGASIGEVTVVGAGAVVEAGTAMLGARVLPPGVDEAAT